jgi:hypothetical protein
MSDAQPVKTPIYGLVDEALLLMAQGGAMRIMDIPNDRSLASHTFSGGVSIALAARVAELEAALAALKGEKHE